MSNTDESKITDDINVEAIKANYEHNYEYKERKSPARRKVIAINVSKGMEAKEFDSMSKCSKAINVNVGLIKNIADRKKKYKSAKSKENGDIFVFRYSE